MQAELPAEPGPAATSERSDRWEATCATCGHEGDLLCCEVGLCLLLGRIHSCWFMCLLWCYEAQGTSGRLGGHEGDCSGVRGLAVLAAALPPSSLLPACSSSRCNRAHPLRLMHNSAAPRRRQPCTDTACNGCAGTHLHAGDAHALRGSGRCASGRLVLPPACQAGQGAEGQRACPRPDQHPHPPADQRCD